MNTTENRALELISSIIVERISTSAIYCFGERKQKQAFENPFKKTPVVEKKNIHFYLLVLVNEYIVNSEAEITDFVETKTKGLYTITLVMHKAVSLRHLTPHKQHFFNEIMTKSYKVYEHETVPPNIAFDEPPKLQTDYMRYYWNNRNNIAETFLDSERQIDGMNTERIQEVMMRMAVEQICLGLINIFLGYHPNQCSLGHLFDLCELFTPLTSEIFPRTTDEDKKLFRLLKINPSALRWIGLKTNSFLSTELLEKRCSLFHEKASALAEAELGRLENLELKN